MKNHQYLNNLTGWIVFIIASAVYLLTIEPTSSFWDCGEFIASSYKLQVGHPPGAPFFMMLGRIFSLLAMGDVTKVAMMVNIMSALCSSFTILFLFWTITAFAKKAALAEGEMTTAKTFVVLGSGVVGALAYTFSDSFWFSAVEGEVYAMSSFFTAAVVWAMVKWESVADKPHADRWLILIAYLMGLSVGVHLLNLLCIPALAFIYYFKKYEFSWKGFIITTITGVGLLVFIQYGIIPGVVKIAAKFEMLFVNSFGMPFNSGLAVYGIVIVSLVSYGLYFTGQKGMRLANTALLCLTVILIGYSSYAMIVIRSSAKPPMNENEPSNVYSLLAYLNREQYGDRPLAYGQYYSTPLAIDYDKQQYKYKDGTPVYYQGKDKSGKDQYLIADDRKGSIPVYDPKFCTIFPRMYSSEGHHKSAYKNWADIKGKKIKTNRPDVKEVEMPTFGENLTFFFKYQLGHMYFRYFMWNFSGRQNNIQGHGSALEGNWITGIPFIDEGLVGSQENLPEYMAENKAMNKFYLLPLIIGILGLVWQLSKDKKDFFVVFLLFIFTGLAIVVYLNQYPYQPRERDYAYAASFYAFSIWIGFGVYSVFDFLATKMPQGISAGIATALCLIAAPIVMAKDGWNDHSRAGRYSARDFAMNYLNSCEPNAILFTNGDNDTFPLWYAQDVEGIRTDVRVVNLSLLNTDWYIDQMKQKAYDSEPLPISFTTEQYRQGTRDYLPIEEITDKAVDLREVMKIVASEAPNAKKEYGDNKINFVPSKRLFIPIDSAQVVSNGYVPKDAAGKVVKQMEWELDKRYILKNDMILLDILANNNWKRPVYFAVTVGSDNYLGLEDYFQLEGMTYKIVPIKAANESGAIGRVNTTNMYENVMTKFKWGGMKDPSLYMDPETVRLTTGLRLNMARLASTLVEENKKDSAIKVLDLCLQEMPDETIPYNFLMIAVAEAYYKANANDKANGILLRLADIYEYELNYYFSLEPRFVKLVEDDIDQASSVLQRSLSLAMVYDQKEVADTIEKKLDTVMEKNAGKMRK
jgi:hypothetical protein